MVLGVSGKEPLDRPAHGCGAPPSYLREDAATLHQAGRPEHRLTGPGNGAYLAPLLCHPPA